MTRYARQIQVPLMGEDGQARLKDAHILIIGAGGLAAPVLQYLVGAGVGRITLIDPDHVEESNLHRQTLFRMSDIGREKVSAAADHMRALNPDCTLTPLNAAFTPENSYELCKSADLVLDCADSFAVSYIASDTCEALNIPLISASVVGTSGYSAGFCGPAPSLRAVFPDLPDQLGSCAENGVLGPCVGIIGSIQAQMALTYLIGSTPSPLGQMVQFDGQNFRASQFRFDGCPNPEQRPSFISQSEIGHDDIVIDLRPPHEDGPRLEGRFENMVERVMHYLPSDIPQEITTGHDRRVVLICRSGLRAWKAAQTHFDLSKQRVVLLALGSKSSAGSRQTAPTPSSNI